MAGKTGIRGEQIQDDSIASADIAEDAIGSSELGAGAVSGQTTITSTDTTNDRLLIWDATDSALKQVSIGNLGVTASPAGSDGQVQYNNGGAAGGAGNLYWDDTNSRVGIGTSSPDYALDVAGNVGFDEYIYHNGDTDTYIRLEDDEINIYAGGIRFITMEEASTNMLRLNHGGNDIDFQVKGSSEANLIRTDAANDLVGIGTSAPRVRMDVHHDPTGLPNDTGGGEVVTFGTEDTTDTLAAGKLMYMATDGKWKYADADAASTSGGVLLGIALGTAVSDGILLRGFFDAATIQGSFAKGAACYVSENEGVIDFTAPSASGDIIRVVGYGTDTTNVIYFNPGSTWIEL